MSNFKKFVAFGMAACMMVGGSITAFAAAGTENTAVEVTGSGTPAFVDKNVFSIDVPTGDALTNTIAFTVDPLGIVPEADSTHAYEEGAKVLFASDKATTTYDFASTSEALTITNKSAVGITLAIEAKVVAGSATYEAGYAKTPDFSEEGDSAKGLYFGIIADNEDEHAMDTTGATFTNVALSAADKYAVTATTAEGVTSYSYALKDNAAGFPEYKFKVTGALNTDLADSTWYTEASGGARTAKTMPSLSVKFTPNGIKDCKDAVILVEDTDFYIAKADAEEGNGGFGTTKPTSVLINGKPLNSGDTIADNADGYVHITWANAYKAYGYEKEEDMPDADAIYGSLKSIKITFGSDASAISYYAEFPQE